MSISDYKWLSGGQGPHGIRHYAILGPVASSDYISASNGHNGDSELIGFIMRGREERAPVRRDHKFSTRFACTVGFMPT